MTKLQRDELQRMTQPALCALYRKLGYVGGLHPLEKWHRDEIINSILTIDVDGAEAGCDKCRQPGTSCGEAGFTSLWRACVGCGELVCVRSRCGAFRTPYCAGRADSVPTTPAVPATGQRAARTARPSRAPRTTGRAAEQADETAAAIARLTAGEPLRLLAALEGPFAPLRTVPGTKRKSLPFYRPTLPPITFANRVVTGYHWDRPYVGRVAVLDRSGAWVAAAASALVAHGGLEHTGEIEFTNRPGYYLVSVYPWRELDRLPHPLGHLREGEAWVLAPTVQLLTRLANEGRWPDAAILDSYTGDGVRTNEWASDHVNTIRKHTISTWGRQSPQYKDDLKTAIGEAMSLMLGKPDGVRRVWNCKLARPDYTHTWQAQAAATLWGWADDCCQVAPDLAPVAVANVDELVVPEGAVEILTTKARSRGRKPMVLDPSGIQLGSFKIKEIQEWAA